MGLGKLFPYGKKENLILTSSSCMHKTTSSSWNRHLNVKNKTLKENRGKYLYDLGIGRRFLNKSQIVGTIKGKMTKFY